MLSLQRCLHECLRAWREVWVSNFVSRSLACQSNQQVLTCRFLCVSLCVFECVKLWQLKCLCMCMPYMFVCMGLYGCACVFMCVCMRTCTHMHAFLWDAHQLACKLGHAWAAAIKLLKQLEDFHAHVVLPVSQERKQKDLNARNKALWASLTCLPKKHMPMLFQSCGELGVCTAATRYLSNAVSMSALSCKQACRETLESCQV